MKAKEVNFNDDSEVNGSQLAKHLGVSPQYIQKLKNQGVLKFIDKKIIIRDAIKSIKDNDYKVNLCPDFPNGCDVETRY
jgi:hypothetical protein